MTFPDDSVQSIVSSWWEECDPKIIKKGSLIFAFVPHVDQIPNTLIEIGRSKTKRKTPTKERERQFQTRDVDGKGIGATNTRGRNGD